MRTSRSALRRARGARGRRGFSLIEVLISLALTSALLTATLAALDASFKSYKMNTESASTHVVARIVMQRLTAMLRTGQRFGPYPPNPILTPQINSDWIEFVSFEDAAAGVEEVTRLERRADATDAGPFVLWYVLTRFENGVEVSTEAYPLLDNVLQLDFELEYEVGPRLRRATVDMVIEPDDLEDAAMASTMEIPSIRLVASASPRAEF